MACLDTTFLLDLRGRGGAARRDRARARIRQLVEAGEPITTTRFNLAELYVGVERANDPDAECKLVDDMASRLVVLDFDDRAARVFGRITARLFDAGQPIGDMDALIAAVAIVHGESLLTRNPRHFSSVPGLTVEGS